MAQFYQPAFTAPLLPSVMVEAQLKDQTVSLKIHRQSSMQSVLFHSLIIMLGCAAVGVSQTTHHAPITLGKLTAPPKIDGVMNESEWSGASKAELNFQIEPGENITASEKTEVWLAADHATLYIAFHAYDSDPSAIRARVSKRDDINDDDLVVLLIDTFNDRQRAYRFTFNPFGIQQDGVFTEQTVDESWDAQYESKGQLAKDGFIVEAAIPFQSIRFRAGKDAKWGLHLRRVIARKAERTSWQPVRREVNSLLLQMGELSGLADVYTGRTLDIIPTLIGSVTSEREAIPITPQRPEGVRNNTVNKLDPGLTAIYSMTPTLTLAATINPDFSQVEADVPQINTNQRFALFYPERRPFFLEGIDVFEPTFTKGFKLLNTRTIVDPDWGLKLTGKLERNAIGVLIASDRAPGLQVPANDPNFGQNALVTVARWQRSFGQDSAVGGFFSDRRFGNASNTVLAGETRVRVSKAANVGFQLVRTRTTDQHSNTQSDWAANTRFTNYGRHWRIFLNDEYVGANYAAQAGFIQRRGYHQQYADIGRVFWAKEGTKLNKWLVNVWPYVFMQRSKQPDGSPEVEYVNPAVDVQFQRNIALTFYHSRDREGFAGKQLSYRFNKISLSSYALKKLSFTTKFVFGEGIFYDFVKLQVGRKNDMEIDLTYRPNNKINVGLLYLKSTLNNPRTGHRLFNQEILRNGTTYQFTPYHSVRSIFDYDTSLRQFGASLLYAYVPRPNTTFYLGYNDLLFNSYDPIAQRRVTDEGLIRQRRALFFKLSYNFRF
ncbi:MAG: carbohydrate binding family 9 domain-containing protein [Blastocatellia bacterium]|nr:carbohydrate binding family 9 domain-containing protein [Blastocatellia bacterium]